LTTNYFSPLAFVVVFGSEIRDPERVKIRIRDKYPGSATQVIRSNVAQKVIFYFYMENF
jgi:hypothetical protein